MLGPRSLEGRPTPTNAKTAEFAMLTATNDEIVDIKPQPIDGNAEDAETQIRPDLLWDDQVRGLCVRAYGDGSKSFIFVYRIHNRQHFIGIGKTPIWSLEAARDRAKKLRSILNQGDDPVLYQKQNNLAPVENLIQYIAEHLQTNP
jgi:hypothetical protein